MYNKLFTKILDSSIWLEAVETRLIWLTLLAAMDETGYAQFASVANLAHRARVLLKDTEKAITCLEGADPNSSDPANEGRRIERVPGGWMVLNAPKYKDLVTRAVHQEQTRIRVARHREKKGCNGHVTLTPLHVTPVTNANASVTPSETDTETKTEGEGKPALSEPSAEQFIAEVRTHRLDAPDSFIRNKYFAKAENGFGRNWRMFASRVAGWWADEVAREEPRKTPNFEHPDEKRMREMGVRP